MAHQKQLVGERLFPLVSKVDGLSPPYASLAPQRPRRTSLRSQPSLLRSCCEWLRGGRCVSAVVSGRRSPRLQDPA